MTKPYITQWPYNKKKALCFTWDDTNYTHFYLALIFFRFGIKETHFLNTSNIFTHHRFYLYLYRFLQLFQVDIGSHTQNHVVVTDISYESLIKELEGSKNDIIKNFRVVPSCFSHPCSAYNRTTDEIIHKYYLDSRYTVEKDNDERYMFTRIRSRYTVDYYKQKLIEFDASDKDIYIFGGHGLDNSGYEPMPWSVLYKLLKHINKEYANRFWIPTFSELSMFLKIKEIGVSIHDSGDYYEVETEKIQKLLEKYPNTAALITVVINDNDFRTIDLQKMTKIYK